MLILLLSTNKRLFSDMSSYNIFFENFFAKVLTFLIGLSIIKSNKSIFRMKRELVKIHTVPPL